MTNGGCVDPDNFSIVDATGRVTTATINNVEGTDPIPTPPVIVVPDLAIVPGDIAPTTCVGATFPFVITGGTPPYNITASPRIGNSPTITPSVVNASGGETDISNVTATVTLSFVDSSSPKKFLSTHHHLSGGAGVPPTLFVNPAPLATSVTRLLSGDASIRNRTLSSPAARRPTRFRSRTRASAS